MVYTQKYHLDAPGKRLQCIQIAMEIQHVLVGKSLN